MNELLLWIEANLTTLFTSAGILGFTTFLYFKFKSVVMPKIINGVVGMFSILISNLFGVSFGESEDIAEALPVVNQLNDLKEDMILNAEAKLLELKQKLTSPIYTEMEKVPLKETFMYLLRRYKNKISPEVFAILEKFDETEA
jgi:hypothetical protein